MDPRGPTDIPEECGMSYPTASDRPLHEIMAEIETHQSAIDSLLREITGPWPKTTDGNP